jgi:D-alanyl-D-alanine-carboxypeptidase/D-alanyl-D-alanine-endopeptidase
VLQPLAWFEGEVDYAVFIRGPREHRTYLHTGLTGGYASQLILAPDTDEVVVILASNSEAPVFRVGNSLLSSRYPVSAGAGTYAVDPIRLAEYVGVYQVDPTRSLTYTAQDGVLYYHFTGSRFVAMTPSGSDAFTIGRRALHRFDRVDGQPARVTASAEGADYSGTRIQAEPPAKAILAEDELRGLLGTYRGRTLTFDVRNEDGQLMVRVGKQRFYPVFLVGDRPDHFKYDIVHAELQFERYPTGKARAVQLFQNGTRQEGVKQ